MTGGGERLLTVLVEPGWLDPTPLLGYRDPLVEGFYRQPEFLKFLLRASRDREAAHVCVLDEMNLSHPEQYLTPVLSAMEQPRGELHLHDNDGDLQGVPPVLPIRPTWSCSGALRPARLHFGWRVIAEVVRYLEARALEGGERRGCDASRPDRCGLPRTQARLAAG